MKAGESIGLLGIALAIGFGLANKGSADRPYVPRPPSTKPPTAPARPPMPPLGGSPVSASDFYRGNNKVDDSAGGVNFIPPKDPYEDEEPAPVKPIDPIDPIDPNLPPMNPPKDDPIGDQHDMHPSEPIDFGGMGGFYNA
jgi:hypothetical protein